MADKFLSAGLRPATPAADIAREVLTDAVCAECGEAGLEYHPFHGSGRYRIVARCRECGLQAEF